MIFKFNIPYQSKNEINYIKKAIMQGKTSGDGNYTKLCEKKLENLLSSRKILMTTSCTHALEVVFELLELKDFEVITPTYNFPSATNAILKNGGKVIFSEVNKEDLCIDVSKIEEKITAKTKAILLVHYGGRSCNMDPILDIANKYNLYIIEDTAQGLFSKYKDKSLGTIGHFGCFSFHETKNISCGEGGALSINIKDNDMIEKAKQIIQKGTNRSAFNRGDVEFYEWVRKGSSYAPSNILMAYLYSQLEDLDIIQEKRKKIFKKYLNFFKQEQFYSIEGFSKENIFGDFNYHIFYVIFKEELNASTFMKELNKKHIYSYTHFVPLHLSEMGISLGYKKEDFLFESTIYKRLVRLPLHSMMDDEIIKYILEEIRLILMRF